MGARLHRRPPRSRRARLITRRAHHLSVTVDIRRVCLTSECPPVTDGSYQPIWTRNCRRWGSCSRGNVDDARYAAYLPRPASWTMITSQGSCGGCSALPAIWRKASGVPGTTRSPTTAAGRRRRSSVWHFRTDRATVRTPSDAIATSVTSVFPLPGLQGPPCSRCWTTLRTPRHWREPSKNTRVTAPDWGTWIGSKWSRSPVCALCGETAHAAISGCTWKVNLRPGLPCSPQHAPHVHRA